MKKQIFDAKIESGERGGAGINIPFDVKEVFGHARVKVKITIDDFTYRSTTFVMGGKYIIPVRKEIREAVGKNTGDTVKVTLEQDTEVREVIIPEDLQKELNKNKTAKEMFNSFAYTHRKEYVRWIESAKKPETRIIRLKKAIEMISNGKNFS